MGKPIGKDASGYEILTVAMKELLNQFPGLLQGESIKFEELEKERGIAFSNNSGSLVYSKKKSITGRIHQICQYPFFVIYRTSVSAQELHKIDAHMFLEILGKWICKEPVLVDGAEYRLEKYPVLTGGRKITEIVRDNCYALEAQQNGVQDWILPVSVEYSNDFMKM